MWLITLLAVLAGLCIVAAILFLALAAALSKK